MVSCLLKICSPPSTYKEMLLNKKLNIAHPVEKVRKPLHNIPLLREQAGMATVEATLVMPLAFVAITLLLRLGFICVVQVQVYEAFSEAIQQTAAHTYIYDGLEKESVSNIGVYGDVAIALNKKLKDVALLESYVVGGVGGVFLTKASCDKNGYLRGSIRYYISVKLPFFKLSPICVQEQMTQKTYSGFVYSAEKEEYVYVTDFQSVYHLTRNCSHLKLTIFKLDKQKKCTLPPCGFCGSSGEAMYATKEGDCYHTTLACQGLKRTIRRVKKTTVAGLPVCEKCGG